MQEECCLETQEVGCHVSISVTFAHGLFHGDLLKSGCSPPTLSLAKLNGKVYKIVDIQLL